MLRALPMLIALFACATLPAQEREDRATIKVGGSITVALNVLLDGRIKVHRNLALSKGDDDEDFFVCILDENRTEVVLFYSKSSKKIHGMHALIFPDLRSRGQRICTEIRSLTLGEDKSYSIEFLRTKPLPPGPAPKGEFPKGEFNVPRSGSYDPYADPFAPSPSWQPPPSSVVPSTKLN